MVSGRARGRTDPTGFRGPLEGKRAALGINSPLDFGVGGLSAKIRIIPLHQENERSRKETDSPLGRKNFPRGTRKSVCLSLLFLVFLIPSHSETRVARPGLGFLNRTDAKKNKNKCHFIRFSFVPRAAQPFPSLPFPTAPRPRLFFCLLFLSGEIRKDPRSRVAK